MSNQNKTLFFFVLPIIAVLAMPPSTLQGALIAIPLVTGFFVLLGILLMRGNSLALTFSIFLQGMNVIVRLMMFFPHAQTNSGNPDVSFMVFHVLGLALSMYLMLRLDKPDVRVMMVT